MRPNDQYSRDYRSSRDEYNYRRNSNYEMQPSSSREHYQYQRSSSSRSSPDSHSRSHHPSHHSSHHFHSPEKSSPHSPSPFESPTESPERVGDRPFHHNQRNRTPSPHRRHPPTQSQTQSQTSDVPNDSNSSGGDILISETHQSTSDNNKSISTNEFSDRSLPATNEYSNTKPEATGESILPAPNAPKHEMNMRESTPPPPPPPPSPKHENHPNDGKSTSSPDPPPPPPPPNIDEPHQSPDHVNQNDLSQPLTNFQFQSNVEYPQDTIIPSPSEPESLLPAPDMPPLRPILSPRGSPYNPQGRNNRVSPQFGRGMPPHMTPPMQMMRGRGRPGPQPGQNPRSNQQQGQSPNEQPQPMFIPHPNMHPPPGMIPPPFVSPQPMKGNPSPSRQPPPPPFAGNYPPHFQMPPPHVQKGGPPPNYPHGPPPYPGFVGPPFPPHGNFPPPPFPPQPFPPHPGMPYPPPPHMQYPNRMGPPPQQSHREQRENEQSQTNFDNNYETNQPRNERGESEFGRNNDTNTGGNEQREINRSMNNLEPRDRDVIMQDVESEDLTNSNHKNNLRNSSGRKNKNDSPTKTREQGYQDRRKSTNPILDELAGMKEFFPSNKKYREFLQQVSLLQFSFFCQSNLIFEQHHRFHNELTDLQVKFSSNNSDFERKLEELEKVNRQIFHIESLRSTNQKKLNGYEA